MSGSGKEMRSLWEALGEIPDRRGAKGRQYALRPVLVLTLAAMLAGAYVLRAIFRWGRRGCPRRRFTCSASSGRRATPCTTTSSRRSTWRRRSGC